MLINKLATLLDVPNDAQDVIREIAGLIATLDAYPADRAEAEHAMRARVGAYMRRANELADGVGRARSARSAATKLEWTSAGGEILLIETGQPGDLPTK